jgi:hypothetical protein
LHWISLYSPPIRAPFSATERFIKKTTSVTASIMTANSPKTIKIRQRRCLLVAEVLACHATAVQLAQTLHERREQFHTLRLDGPSILLIRSYSPSWSRRKRVSSSRPEIRLVEYRTLTVLRLIQELDEHSPDGHAKSAADFCDDQK